MPSKSCRLIVALGIALFALAGCTDMLPTQGSDYEPPDIPDRGSFEMESTGDYRGSAGGAAWYASWPRVLEGDTIWWVHHVLLDGHVNHNNYGFERTELWVATWEPEFPVQAGQVMVDHTVNQEKGQYLVPDQGWALETTMRDYFGFYGEPYLEGYDLVRAGPSEHGGTLDFQIDGEDRLVGTISTEVVITPMRDLEQNPFMPDSILDKWGDYEGHATFTYSIDAVPLSNPEYQRPFWTDREANQTTCQLNFAPHLRQACLDGELTSDNLGPD